jgi:hypothetical protein
VASASASASAYSSFRVNPWLVFFFLAHPSLLLPVAGGVD